MTKNRPKIYNVLIIEDHEIVSQAFISALECVQKQTEDTNFSIQKATNKEAAIEKIKTLYNNNLDLIFLDINIPDTNGGKTIKGECFGKELKLQFPKTKIIVCTSHRSNLRLNTILKVLNPEAFLLKSDINAQDFINAIQTVIDDKIYYSETVLKLVRSQMKTVA